MPNALAQKADTRFDAAVRPPGMGRSAAFLSIIDAAGNAYLHAPGMYIYSKGERRLIDGSIPRLEPVSNKAAALRVTFILLCNPSMVQAPYREIVEHAGVSLGTVGRIFEDLKKRGFLIGPEKTHGRRMLDPNRLLAEWTTNYPIALRPKLSPRRFTAPDPNWWKQVQLDSSAAVWGGEVAAERMTKYLRAATQTIYIDRKAMHKCLRHLVTTHRLKSDPYGPIEILERFWKLPEDTKHFDLAPPVLVYADLIATLEPRNIEVAKIIKEAHIENALHTT